MSDQERCPTVAEVVRLLHRKGLCDWDYVTYEEMEKSGAECECYEYASAILRLFRHDSAHSSVAEQPQPDADDILAQAFHEADPNEGREQAVEGLVIDIETARLINGAFLPTNPNKMRSACPEVIQAAKKFKDALAHYEASRGERQ